MEAIGSGSEYGYVLKTLVYSLTVASPRGDADSAAAEKLVARQITDSVIITLMMGLLPPGCAMTVSAFARSGRSASVKSPAWRQERQLQRARVATGEVDRPLPRAWVFPRPRPMHFAGCIACTPRGAIPARSRRQGRTRGADRPDSVTSGCPCAATTKRIRTLPAATDHLRSSACPPARRCWPATISRPRPARRQSSVVSLPGWM